MCFAPQRRALFRHLNFQKWSERGVFCAFWLGNVLRATTACNCSSLIWPAGSAPAGLASLTLRSHKSLETHSVSRLSYLFAHLHLLSSDSFSSILLSSDLSLLYASSLLCFSSVHIVGSLTSKLPSVMWLLRSFVSCRSCCCTLWRLRPSAPLGTSRHGLLGHFSFLLHWNDTIGPAKLDGQIPCGKFSQSIDSTNPQTCSSIVTNDPGKRLFWKELCKTDINRQLSTAPARMVSISSCLRFWLRRLHHRAGKNRQELQQDQKVQTYVQAGF